MPGHVSSAPYIETDYDRLAGHYGAALALASHSSPREAEPPVRRAVELDPTLVQARRNLVLILMDERRTQEASESLRLAIEATGDRPEYSDPAWQLNGP